MRRIIEFFFRNVGGLNKQDVTVNLKPELRPVGKSLLVWLDDGSHTVMWDIDYAPVESDKTIYLRVFKRLFKAAGQENHYDMMMNESK